MPCCCRGGTVSLLQAASPLIDSGIPALCNLTQLAIRDVGVYMAKVRLEIKYFFVNYLPIAYVVVANIQGKFEYERELVA